MSHTLLLADGSATIRRVVELTFADSDVHVLAVADGEAAIARLNGHPPDIVLADVAMPGRNGYDIAAYMKESPALAHIPVVLLTGAFEPVDETRVTAGCSVLAKPFEPQRVVGRVRELLAARPEPIVAPLDPLPIVEDGTLRPPQADSEPRNFAELEEYFDQLDAAFATLSSSTRALSPRPVQGAVEEAVEAGWVPDAEGDPAPEAPASTQPLASSVVSGDPTAAVRTPSAQPPAVVSDALVDEVFRRVLERLTDRIVREAVAESVSTIAERLVREEIEKIKASVS